MIIHLSQSQVAVCEQSRCRRESQTACAAVVGAMGLHKRSRQASPLSAGHALFMRLSASKLHSYS